MKFDLVRTARPVSADDPAEQPPTLRELTADLSAHAGKVAEQLDAAFGELAALTFRSECPEPVTGTAPGTFQAAKFSVQRDIRA